MRKKIVGLVVALCMLTTFMPCVVSAAYRGTKYGDIYYEVDDNGHVVITDCVETATTIDIPRWINGLPVTSIGQSAFYNCTKLKSVTIPNGVEKLEECAFYCCTSLTDVNLPVGLQTIGASAFNTCRSLTDIQIPISVRNIEEYAFSDCSSLKSITIPKNVSVIRNAILSGCSALENITVDPDNQYYCSVDGHLFNMAKTELLQYAIGKKNNLYVIPDGVKKINNKAFWYSGLTAISIPNSVERIGEATFWGCSNLTSVTIPNSVIDIDRFAFYDCSSITSVTIGANTTHIASNVFHGCSSIADVYYSGTEAQWKKIYMEHGNECLTNANLHFNSVIQVPATVSGEIGLPQTKSGASYRVQLAADDGKSYKWELARGIMPKGLTISQDGMITGMPTNAGSYGYMDIRLTDSEGNSRIEPFSMNILPEDVHVELVGTSTFTYDGDGHKLQFRCKEVPDLELNVSYGINGEAAPTEAGSYYARVSSANSLYHVVSDIDYHLTINKLNVKITHGPQTYAYDGNSHSYKYTASEDYIPVVKYKPYSDSDDLLQPNNDSGYTETPPTNAGRYRVWISTADKNHSIYDDSNKSPWYVFGEMTISE